MPGDVRQLRGPIHAPDRQLVAASQRGDRHAFGILYARHASSVFAYSLRILRDAHAAEDVRQETFLKAWRNVGSFDLSKELWPWLQTIAHRLCIDEMRRRRSKREGPLTETTVTELPIDGPPEPSVALTEAFSALPSRHRQLLLLQAIEGRSYAEIARAEGSSVTAVAKALARARERVRSAMERAGHALGLIPAWLALRQRGRRLGARLAGPGDIGLRLDSTILHEHFGVLLIAVVGGVFWGLHGGPSTIISERPRPPPVVDATTGRAHEATTPATASTGTQGPGDRLSRGSPLVAEVQASPARPGGVAPSSQSLVVEVTDPQGNLLLRQGLESDCGGQGGQILPRNGPVVVVC